MRSTRLLLAALAVAATLPGGTTAQAAGASVDVTVTFAKTQVDVATLGHATGVLTYPYSVQYEITGTISGDGYTTVIEQRWTEVIVGAGSPRVAHHRYPVATDSTVHLAYAIELIAASGVPTVYCAGTTDRTGSGPVTTAGTC